MNTPTKIALGSIAVVAVGTTGFFAAPIIATCLGSLGLLGTTATTGTIISSLSGAALTNASLAALGGGALTAGGFGIAGGTIVVTGASATVGGAATGAITWWTSSPPAKPAELAVQLTFAGFEDW